MTIWGIEKDGTVNHFLETRNSPHVYYNYLMSYSNKQHLPIQPNKWFKARVNMDCSKDRISRGHSFTHLCHVEKIEVLETKDFVCVETLM